MNYEAAIIRFTGVVQGVGFRPFVFRIAQDMYIRGWVNNTTTGVTIHAEGKQVAEFYQRLLRELPPLAIVKRHELMPINPQGYTDFTIVRSDSESSREVLISPDVATCSECLAEIRGPTNRRYKYPFTNCTNCGPRYSIIHDIPYDRPNTTMSTFSMCQECGAEYQNPYDRRFHAQPIACPHCGPLARLQDVKGQVLEGLGQSQLAKGAIIAVKGLGGFHLACDALNRRVVDNLRKRKLREAKPFAVMAKNLEVARRYCYIDAEEEKLLTSPAAPIVILRLKGDLADLGLPEGLAPNLDTLGIMLPYTPLHHLLFEDTLTLLVMTSANRSGEPLLIDNGEALTKLRGIADYWLLHDREIYHPCDDSVLRVIHKQPVFLRRARGYVPLPIELDEDYLPVMGVGGDLKNTFCLLKGGQAFISQHGGDLSNYDNYRRFTGEVEAFQRVVNATPSLLAYDLHPEYFSSRFAKTQGLIPAIPVQHHHAHLASCLAENGVRDKVLGVVCDGTGFGADEKIWGFEFLWGDCREYNRIGHLEYLPLPGGDTASKYPTRIALAYLIRLFNEGFEAYLPNLTKEEIAVIAQQVKNGFNTFLTSSCGRLFDAVAGLAGICQRVSYEGQAAIELEAAVDETEQGLYPFTLASVDRLLEVRVKPMFTAILADLAAGVAQGTIAAKFHHTVGEIILQALDKLSLAYSTKQVALAGGVFQNKYLVEYLVPRLSKQGFTIYQHRLLSPGDGSLCLGQAVIASEVRKNVLSNPRQSSECV